MQPLPKKLLPIALALLLVFGMSPLKSSAKDVTTDDIVTATTTGTAACLGWRPEGICVALVCTPTGCGIETSLRIGHFLPDLVVSGYRNIGENPWVEARALYGAASIAAAQGIMSALGGDLEIGSGNQTVQDRGYGEHKNLRFKEADAIGNPFAASFGLLGAGFMCQSRATPMLAYLLSPVDAATWRWGFAEMLYPASFIPGMREIGNTVGFIPINTWGPVHPRTGWVTASEDPKAGAVAAQRAADIVTRTGQPHVYVPLTSGRLPRSESCPVMENDEDNSKWQMVSPKPQSSCEVFGQNDSLWLSSWAANKQEDDSESYVWLLWRKYSCCTSTRGTLLFTTGGAVCG